METYDDLIEELIDSDNREKQLILKKNKEKEEKLEAQKDLADCYEALVDCRDAEKKLKRLLDQKHEEGKAKKRAVIRRAERMLEERDDEIRDKNKEIRELKQDRLLLSLRLSSKEGTLALTESILADYREEVARINAPQQTVPRPHKCHICRDMFTTEQRLNIHYTKIHTEYCWRCDRMFCELPEDIRQYIHNRAFTKGEMSRGEVQQLRHNETCGRY